MTVRNVRQVGIRMSAAEKKLVEAAAEALSAPGAEVTPSQLFFTAGLEEAAALGITAATLASRVRSETGVWRNKPERSYSSLDLEEDRTALTITIHPLHYLPISEAARWSQVKVPTFLWGSLMVFLAKRKLAEPDNRKLQKLHLPAQYEPR